mgnify:CR=1 FL=1
MPLLRFKAGEWNSEIIKHRITQALSQNYQLKNNRTKYELIISHF